MCGIFGVRRSWLARQMGDANGRIASAMNALRWRGRDEARVITIGDFVIGCARLAISDRRSSQPVARRGARWAGALNGAVTNARELWAEHFPAALRRPSLPNDAWLPVLLAQLRGAIALGELSGHHAAVVVDTQCDEWFVQRDAFGEKPLFVLRERGEPVAFASTLPALRALGAEFALDGAATARFFRYGATGTIAHARGDLAVCDERGGFCVHGKATAQTDAPTFASAFPRAVARCADVAVPLGLFLSGGIDSSCIAAELQALGRRVRAYQFCAHGEPSSERDLAEVVAARTGHELVRVDAGKEALDALPMLTTHWGLPLGDPSVLAAHAVARVAARDGVRVLLSGEGADEGMFGYARHRALVRMGPVRIPLPWLPQWSMSTAARSVRALAARDPYASLLEVVPPAFCAQALDLAEGRLDDNRASGSLRFGAAERMRRASELDREFYLRSDLLPKLDVATMAAQVEARCPFLDGEVTRALAALPMHERFGKRPLRNAYASKLPSAVFTQRKRGFALPLDRWFREELSLLDLLREPRTRQRAHVRVKGLDRAIDLHRSHRVDLGRALYLVAAYEIWLRSEEARCA